MSSLSSGDSKNLHRRRVLVLCLGLLMLVAGVVLVIGGPGALPFACAFHELTGWHCAGCGMTRATDALLHGQVAKAFALNPLGVVLVPVLAGCLAFGVVRWLRGGEFCGRSWGRAGWWLLGLVLLYTVLRNLPGPLGDWLGPG